MTRVFEKQYVSRNGIISGLALRDFAALCAAGESYFGEALVAVVQVGNDFQPNRVVTPGALAECCFDAWELVKRRTGKGDSAPAGFLITPHSVVHGGGRTKATLEWRNDGVCVAIDCDSDSILEHARCAWREALGLPLESEAARAAATEYGQVATAVVDQNWGDFDNLNDGYLVGDWQDWAEADLAWRARKAGLTKETTSPVKPELPEDAKEWARLYAETRERNRRPTKRVVVRRAAPGAPSPDKTPE